MIKTKDEFVDTPLPYVVMLVICLFWFVMIVGAPLLYKIPVKYTYFADLYYYLFHYTCHQNPARCYWIFDYQLPVCVRCFGLYLGTVIALVIYPVIKSVRSTKLPSKWLLLVCFVPIGIDGICSALHVYPSSHWSRLITGFICGFIAIYFIIPGINDAVNLIKEGG
ncbi:MAG: DUF2085 domain-containing protein [Vampirovibrionia bacterium]